MMKSHYYHLFIRASNNSFDGGSLRNSNLSPGDVDPDNYRLGILMALVTGACIVGGLRAVIITGVVQSVLMLIGGLIVAFIVSVAELEVGRAEKWMQQFQRTKKKCTFTTE